MPIAFFGLAIFAWVQLGNVAASDMTRHYYHFASVAVALLLTACVHPGRSGQTLTLDDRSVGPRLSQAEAILIAKQAAEHNGARLSEYIEPRARYETTDPKTTWFLMFDGPNDPYPGNHTWFIHFEGIHNYPGDYFDVYVDDKTGRTRLIGGM